MWRGGECKSDDHAEVSEENVVEKDQQSDGQSVEEEDSQGGKRTTKETSSDKTSIYEQKSDGTQVPYVSKNSPRK